MANHIHTDVEAVAEVYVWLCSQIGRPVDDPWITAAQVVLASGASLGDVEAAIKDIINGELANMPSFLARLARGAFSVW